MTHYPCLVTHPYDVTIAYSVIDQALAWADDEIGGDCYLTWITSHNASICFKRIEDALFFKLRWA